MSAYYRKSMGAYLVMVGTAAMADSMLRLNGRDTTAIIDDPIARGDGTPAPPLRFVDFDRLQQAADSAPPSRGPKPRRKYEIRR